MPERFNWHTKQSEVHFSPLRPELVESTYLLHQVRIFWFRRNYMPANATSLLWLINSTKLASLSFLTSFRMTALISTVKYHRWKKNCLVIVLIAAIANICMLPEFEPILVITASRWVIFFPRSQPTQSSYGNQSANGESQTLVPALTGTTVPIRW